MVAELIREAALEGVSDELPHSIAVVVEEMAMREDRHPDRPLLDIHANLFVERSSQKAIVIGAKGARLRDVGTRSRAAIEAMMGTPGVPRPARQGRQGVAARPQAAAPPRVLRRRTCRRWRGAPGRWPARGAQWGGADLPRLRGGAAHPQAR